MVYGHPACVGRFAQTCRRYYKLVITNGLLRAGSWKHHLYMKACLDPQYKKYAGVEFELSKDKHVLKGDYCVHKFMYDLNGVRKHRENIYMFFVERKLDVWTMLENMDIPWNDNILSSRLMPYHLNHLERLRTRRTMQLSLEKLSKLVSYEDVRQYPKLPWHPENFTFIADLQFMMDNPQLFFTGMYVFRCTGITSKLLTTLALRNQNHLKCISGYTAEHVIDVLRAVKLKDTANCKTIRDPEAFIKIIRTGCKIRKHDLTSRQIYEYPEIMEYLLGKP